LWCHSHNYFSPASARHWQILFQAIGTQLVALRLMIFINIMKIVSNALENHNGMGEIDPDTTTNGGKSRSGLQGMAFCRLSVNWLRVHGCLVADRFLQNGSGEDTERR
jgi:hypothetical protein